MSEDNVIPLPKPSQPSSIVIHIGGIPVASNPSNQMSTPDTPAQDVLDILENAIKKGIFEDLKEPDEQGIVK